MVNWSFNASAGVGGINWSNLSGGGFQFDTIGNANIYNSIWAWNLSALATANASGNINVTGEYRFHDTFTPELQPNRRLLAAQALNSSQYILAGVGAYVLSSNDSIDTWYTRGVTLTNLSPGQSYIIGFWRFDLWAVDWQIMGAANNVSASSPIIPLVIRQWGRDQYLKICNASSLNIQAVLGDVEEAEFNVYTWDFGAAMNLGQGFLFPVAGGVLYNVKTRYRPLNQSDEYKWQEIYHFIDDGSPPARDALRWANISGECFTLFGVLTQAVEYSLDRYGAWTAAEDFLAVSMSHDNFSFGSLVQHSAPPYFASDVRSLYILSNDLTPLWSRMGVRITYAIVPSAAGTDSIGLDVVPGVKLYTGFVEYSNQSAVRFIGSTGQIQFGLGNFPNYVWQSAMISDYALSIDNLQKRRLEWAALMLGSAQYAFTNNLSVYIPFNTTAQALSPSSASIQFITSSFGVVRPINLSIVPSLSSDVNLNQRANLSLDTNITGFTALNQRANASLGTDFSSDVNLNQRGNFSAYVSTSSVGSNVGESNYSVFLNVSSFGRNVEEANFSAYVNYSTLSSKPEYQQYDYQATINNSVWATTGYNASVTQDSDTYEGDPGTNFHGQIQARVSDRTGQHWRFYMQFDMSSVNKPIITVLSAELRLNFWENYSTAANNSRICYPDLYSVSATFGETTITWNNQPAVQSLLASNLSGANTKGALWPMDVKDFFANVLSNGAQYLVLALVNTSSYDNLSDNRTNFFSDEMSAAYAPRIHVTYI